jgi:sugar-specific transcriptional regulator TrmB
MEEDEIDINENYELKKKVQKEYPTFTDAVDPLSVKELDDNLIIYSKYREETMEAQRIDKRLAEVKEEIAAASKPYDAKIKDYKSALNKLKKFIDKEISKPQLEQTLLEYTKLLAREERSKTKDRDLTSLKELSKELSKPYSEALTALKLKISYLNALVEEKSEGLSDKGSKS